MSDQGTTANRINSPDDSLNRHGIGAETVGWIRTGKDMQYVISYGPKTSKYRLSSFATTQAYEENPPKEDNLKDPSNSLGHIMLGPRKYKYTKHHILAIHGVAWSGD